MAAHWQERIPRDDGFSPEREFLLRLLGRRELAQDALIRKDATTINWPRLFEITPSDVQAYLGHKLAELGLERKCPALLWEQTLNHRRVAAAEWLRLGLELSQLSDTFNKHNIDFLLLKGAVLAFTAYPDPSLRSMTDLDFLLRSEDLEQAVELVHEAGFRYPERYRFATLSRRSLPPSRLEWSLPLQKPGTRVLIELHSQLESAEPWFQVSPHIIWENTEETTVNGLRARTLEKHEFLFHLVLHLARSHVFEHGLRPMLDVHLWVELHKDRLNWEHLASETKRRGYGNWVHLVLKIVSDLFATPIAERFFDIVPPPPQFERLRHLANEQIWAERRIQHQAPPFLVLVLAEPSPKKAASLMFRRVWPDWGRMTNPTVPALKTLRRGGLAIRLRRAVAELRVKVPQYCRAFRNGSLSWINLQRARKLEQGRVEILQTLVNHQK
jgi:hypothetical protein